MGTVTDLLPLKPVKLDSYYIHPIQAQHCQNCDVLRARTLARSKKKHTR